MPFIVIGEKDYKPSQRSNKSHNLKHAGNAPTSPPGIGPGSGRTKSNPSRSKPGDGKK